MNAALMLALVAVMTVTVMMVCYSVIFHLLPLTLLGLRRRCCMMFVVKFLTLRARCSSPEIVLIFC